MGESQLRPVAEVMRLRSSVVGAVVALVASADAGLAQGVAYRERWGYLHLEERRAEVRQELVGRDAEMQARVAELLAAPDGGIPFVPAAKALAALRGQTYDDAFLLRTTIGSYVLPEVCDPEAQNEVCRSANLTLFLPFAVPLPGDHAFEYVVHDYKGEVVWQVAIGEKADLHDLRMGNRTAKVPVDGLVDGAYSVVLRTRLGGAAPAAGAPERAWTFHVLRGYQERAERAMTAARERSALTAPRDHGLLLGAVQAVSRAYHGEAFLGRSDAVKDLLHLEHLLATLEAGRPVEQHFHGDRLLLLPTAGGMPLQCILRLAQGAGRPFVVVIAGAPSYDGGFNKPAAPVTREPGWLAREFPGFGGGETFHVAFLESPGGRDYAAALRSALPLLQRLVGPDTEKPVLVAEREAAAIVALRIGEFRDQVAGLVLVGSGAMTPQGLAALGDLPVRVVAQRGAGEESLGRMLDYVAHKQKDGGWQGDIAWLQTGRPAWALGLPMLREPLLTWLDERGKKAK